MKVKEFQLKITLKDHFECLKYDDDNKTMNYRI